MTRETKAGLVVSCSFLCLVGVVLFSKLNEKEVAGTEGQEGGGFAEMTAEPRAVATDNPGASPENKAASPAAQGESRQVVDTKGVVRADYQVSDERGNSNALRTPAASPKQPAPKEPEVKSPSPAVNASNEPPMPPPSPTPGDSSPTISPTPPALTSDLTIGSDGASSSSGAGPGPAREKAHAASSETTPAGPPVPARNGADTPTTPTRGNEAAAPGAPLPGLSKSVTTTTGNTAAPGVPSSPPVPTNAVDASDSAGRGGKPATPLVVPAGPGPSVPFGGPLTAKPAASGTSALATAPAPGLTNAGTPKPTEMGPAPSPASKDWSTMDSTPKRDAPPSARAPSDHPKPMVQLLDPPPPAPGVVPSPKEPTPLSDKGPEEGGTSASVSPRDPRSAAGVNHKPTGSSGDYKPLGAAEGTSATGPAATPPSVPPTTSPLASPSFDTSPRANLNYTPRSSSGLPGSTQEFGTRQGSNGGVSSPGSPLAARDKSPMPETAPLRPAVSQAPVDGGIAKSVQLGSPAIAPSRPSQSIQTPAASTPGPVAFGPAQSSAGGVPQVESYDENTYICKANDTFRVISQESYRTGQYEGALLLFNRNHPLATNALRQNPPLLQAGQPIYIPPVRILEKYYGASVLDSPPPAPFATPPARGIDQPDATGSVRPANTSLAGPVIPARPLPPPGSMPLYRVHEGGEMLREIARRTLGTGDRWAEIYRLNPRVDPREVVPGGSQLRLPRDARVDPQDMP